MTRQLSQQIGTFHFIGIGGIGMSGIAELMHHLGYRVSGSDQSVNANVQRLRKLGISVFEGHCEDNLAEADYVVRSTAIKADNPEIQEARRRAIPIVHRAEMLGEMMLLKNAIAVAGTHGKTTTTSLIAHVLVETGIDATVINGGIINQFGSNARLGDGEWMVVEADESDGSFVKLPAVAGVITNIDAEHLDFYSDFDSIKATFSRFIDNIPFFGFAVLCTDDAEVQALLGTIKDRRVISYGFNPHAEIRAENVRTEGEYQHFDVHVRPTRTGARKNRFSVSFQLLGDHNISNALAAIAVALELGVEHEKICSALASFSGVRRRFEKVGQVEGVLIIDDYAHHPTEIEAVISAARRMDRGRLFVVFQPHRYSRLSHLYDDFLRVLAEADCLLVLPVYAAGEEPLEDCHHETFVRDMNQRGHRDVVAVIDTAQALAVEIRSRMAEGDVVLCLGAGSSSALAHALPEALLSQQEGGGEW